MAETIEVRLYRAPLAAPILETYHEYIVYTNDFGSWYIQILGGEFSPNFPYALNVGG